MKRDGAKLRLLTRRIIALDGNDHWIRAADIQAEVRSQKFGKHRAGKGIFQR